MARRATVRLTDIAEILGVTHQRTSKIVEMRSFPSRSADTAKAACGIGGGHGVAKVWRREKPWRWRRSGTR